MSSQELADKINYLLSNSDLCDEDSFVDNDFEDMLINREKLCFCISKSFLNLYSEIFHDLYGIGEIRVKHSLKEFQKRYNTLLFDLKKKATIISSKHIDSFIYELNTQACEDFVVFHEIYGINISTDAPVEFGNFCLLDAKKHKNKLIEITEMSTEEELFKKLDRFAKYDKWICTRVNAVDVDKAIELAYKNFEIIQGICSFIADFDYFNLYAVGILNDLELLSKCNYAISSSSKTLYRRFWINRSYFDEFDVTNLINDKHRLFSNLIDRLFLLDNNKVNNRIKNAFVNYGRAVCDTENCHKFISFITCIESLIEFKEKEALTNKTIQNFSAIYSDSADEYNKMKDVFQQLYDIRSEISHGDITYVSEGDISDAKKIAMCIIRKFISDGEIEKIKSNCKLREYIRKKVANMEEHK